MPAPPKTSEAAVVAAARRLLEAGGPEAVTMQAVAAAVGIRPPSLYKRFRDRAALLAAVEVAVLAAAREVLEAAAEAAPGDGPRATIEAQVRAYRAFARRNPRGYALIYDPGAARGAAQDAARQATVASPLRLMAAIVGEARALTALRTLTAFIHGFVTVEAAGLFRLGGDVDADFEAGLAMILDGIEASARAERPRGAAEARM